jgi:hypothetical protein
LISENSFSPLFTTALVCPYFSSPSLSLHLLSAVYGTHNIIIIQSPALYLRRCFTGRIRHTLDGLPEILDESSGRALRDIDKAKWELNRRLLQFVAVAGTFAVSWI